ncbi:MAG: TIGR03960 family B12-binding radical SAM protein [Planctomycetota bacterium]|nr:TIGR03960 family B12-binding radical SAM protein [Planctomycetota bacterium]
MISSLKKAAGLRNAELRRYVERQILPFVSTPAQYAGGELNQVVKDHAAMRAKVALAFPDTYTMGMSSTGFKILYGLWNEQPDIVCERCFAPWPDMEARMREHGAPLYTLETFTPVSEYDVLAFSVAYEMGFTNMLTMLDLAGIPLKAEARDRSHPIVIMGGHTAFAPEPIADYVDAFCIGEGEELALEVVNKVVELKKLGLPREELLYRLCREVEGVYVPRFYRFEYFPDNSIADVVPLKNRLPFPVKRRTVHDFENAYFPTKQIVPYVETVFERFSIEIMRGCVNGCRFCQAGMITRGQRQRSPEKVIELAKKGFEQTGYDEIGLLSLSSSDYVGITDLARQLNDYFEDRGIGVALPSLRIGTVLATLPKEMSRVRKGGLTIAPEAASERLRNIINKPVRDDHLIAGCLEAFKHGYDHVKLYFMCGLPGENDEDLRAIGRLSDTIALTRTRVGKPPAKVSTSVSSFVPKAGTPFQWAPMLTRDEWRRRQQVIRSSTRVKSVKVKVHEPDCSYLEGLFSRGDRRLGAAIETAWRLGARFDGWDDQLRMDAWGEAFKQHNIEADWYALRERPTTEILPWVCVNDTVSEGFLKRELKRAEKGMVTQTCADADKDPCFICDACERSPLYEKKLEMLAAPLNGLARDAKYAAKNWTFPAGAQKTEAAAGGA